MENDLLVYDRKTILQSLPEEGFILLIDKEPDWTSFDVVAKLRNILKIKKIGYAGTLDPFATGLLLILVGKATKKQDELMLSDKVYETDIKLGEKTDSFDRTGAVIAYSEKQVSDEEIRSAVMSFTGEQLQLPPMFSAIKKDGKRLYELARKGIEIEREPRKITIHSIDILSIQANILRVRIHCSKGTYIRSLADDIGDKLGTYAHLKELRRISIGGYSVENAFKIGEFAEIFIKNTDIK
jgi:tRNA pseudouridine55 synthase